MKKPLQLSSWLLGALVALTLTASAQTVAANLKRITHNNPGAVTGLGVGLWGWPIPYDRNDDGLQDLIVSSGGTPDRGAYYFENTGKRDPKTGTEIFKSPVRLGDGGNDITPSYMADGSVRVLGAGKEYPDFLRTGADHPVALPVDPKSVHPIEPVVRNGRNMLRGNQWSYVDYTGSGKLDLIVGLYDYSEYGWDDAYDANGRWTNGPLHGYVFRLENKGTNEKPVYAESKHVNVERRVVDVYGLPSPQFADFRGTGKLDLICGEFVDGLTFFENTGTREDPKYITGRRLRYKGELITMPLCMIVVVAYDWNRDGRPDLVIGQEDGRVAWMENTGKIVDGMPEFLPPRFFLQEADEVKFGVLAIPVSFDWDGDGQDDLIVGNTAGEVGFIKNLGGNPVKWAPPVSLQAGDKTLRIMADYNLSIQGPCESKFGYTNPGVGDWDGDGLPDLIVNTIIGKIMWFKNIGTRTNPKLAEGQPVQVAWDGKAPKPTWNWWDPAPGELVVHWRCTPYVIDLDGDGINDLVAPDHEGYLAFYKQVVRGGKRVLLPGQRVFKSLGVSEFDGNGRAMNKADGLLRINSRFIGASGRRTFTFADWDGDGKLDLLVNSVNTDFFRNVSKKPGEWVFENQGPLDGKKLAGHNTAPTIVDWDRNGIPDLLVGAEDGYFYYMKNPRAR